MSKITPLAGASAPDRKRTVIALHCSGAAGRQWKPLAGARQPLRACGPGLIGSGSGHGRYRPCSRGALAGGMTARRRTIVTQQMERKMQRVLAMLYGLAAYFVFFATILYAIGFVTGLIVPKTIDSGPAGAPTEAIIVNLLLMSLFAVQHSVMARPSSRNGGPASSRTRSSAAPMYCLPVSRSFCCSGNGGRSRQWCGTSITRSSPPRSGHCLFGWVLVFCQHVPDQPLRAVRPAQVTDESRRQADARGAIQDAVPVQPGAPPDLSRFHHLLLGHTGDDGGAPAVCRSDDGLHLCRHRARGT